MKIELIYETTCPNKEATKKLLQEILEEYRISANFLEINKDDPETPVYFKRFSSPTILIDGKDIDSGSGGNACRLYKNELGKLSGVPSKELLQRSILKANKDLHFSLLSFLPLLGSAFLPVMSCPACYPLYGSVLASIGFGFFDYTPYLKPFVFILSLIAVIGVSLYYDRTKKWMSASFVFLGILLLGLSKLFLEMDSLSIIGISLFVFGFILSKFEVGRKVKAVCSTC
ncbi:hypothetical protein LEP1GSC050_2776 [Leptospira broomii serovar Hurstbridge str. 5399]|uniref:Glutaredoxin n=1 Tax=Leptospira broomii serovar Hurstbridge str. 5399 TaxID=1049789 RepID=T0GBK7_9LEPT|nr:alkylmercury lyase [Leptospira broomii]EQA44189.1 hypothetical protein LEP1GSC050_2776 [Leptospira broomii serovar Hurstbridge str. 5399]